MSAVARFAYAIGVACPSVFRSSWRGLLLPCSVRFDEQPKSVTATMRDRELGARWSLLNSWRRRVMSARLGLKRMGRVGPLRPGRPDLNLLGYG